MLPGAMGRVVNEGPRGSLETHKTPEERELKKKYTRQPVGDINKLYGTFSLSPELYYRK